MAVQPVKKREWFGAYFAGYLSIQGGVRLHFRILTELFCVPVVPYNTDHVSVHAESCIVGELALRVYLFYMTVP